jgi:O-antigen ligase
MRITPSAVSGQSALERVLLVGFALFLFASTFSISLSQMSLLATLLLFVVHVVLTRERLFVPGLRYLYIAMALWVGWLVLTAALNGPGLVSVYDSRQEWLFVAVFIGAYLLRREGRLGILMNVFAAGVLLISAYSVCQYFTGWAWFVLRGIDDAPQFGYRVTGFFGGLVTFGNFYAVASSILIGYLVGGYGRFQRVSRWLIPAAATLGSLATVLNFGRACTAALVGTVIVLLLLRGRRYGRVAAALAVTLGATLLLVPGVTSRFTERYDMDFGGSNPAGRIYIWENTCRIISDSPLIGVGAGNFKQAYVDHLQEEVSPKFYVGTAHNDFLNVAVTAGIPGLVLFLLVWIALVGYMWRGYRKLPGGSESQGGAAFWAALAGSVCFLGISMYHGNWVDQEVRGLLMFAWAMGLACWYKTETGTPAA